MKLRPGPGWKRHMTGVWDHISGVRIHVHGLAVIGDKVIDGCSWPESKRLDHCIRICGGNRRRGVMVWALQLRKGIV